MNALTTTLFWQLLWEFHGVGAMFLKPWPCGDRRALPQIFHDGLFFLTQLFEWGWGKKNYFFSNNIRINAFLCFSFFIIETILNEKNPSVSRSKVWISDWFVCYWDFSILVCYLVCVDSFFNFSHFNSLFICCLSSLSLTCQVLSEGRAGGGWLSRRAFPSGLLAVICIFSVHPWQPIQWIMEINEIDRNDIMNKNCAGFFFVAPACHWGVGGVEDLVLDV